MRSFLLLMLASAWLVPAAELPVREVILYKHGIGFFERAGQLGPGESARLDFKASEMNDVLKSLTIREQGGGRISGLRYDSADPLDRKLAEFPFQLGEAQALSAVLDQVKGARLELQTGSRTVTGSIVNARLIAASEKTPEREQVTLLLDSGEMQTLDLNAATGIHFVEPQLARQFREYLGTLTAARSQDKRSVYIDSTDAKGREVVASYAIPAAVWKSSYRLLLDGTGSQPVLEGWAVVDNTTGEDWTKITLALVSGRPISFISQLYPPRYVNRPAGDLPEDQAYGPVIHEGSYSVAGMGGAVTTLGTGAAPAPPPPPRKAAEMAPSAGLSRLEQFAKLQAAPSTTVNTALAQAAGDLFEYRLSQPVTIRKNESAMLPFLQQKMEARKLLIYSQRGSGHPTNAAELTNSSGKTLDGGPVTVYDSGNYAGEALMETLKSGDKRLISYAVDLGTRITEAFGSSADVVREVHASHGILIARTAAEETTTYTIRNVDPKAKTLILEHPLRNGYTLLNLKPAEKTSSAYRFEIKLAAGATESFPVAEERVYDNSFQLASMNADSLLVYVSNKNLSEAGRKQLSAIADRQNQLSVTGRQLQEVKGKIDEANGDQDRLRRNIESLNRVSGQQQQVQEYAHKLAAAESQLAALRDRQAELQKNRAAVEQEISRMVQDLAF